MDSLGDEAADLAAETGLVLDGWQRWCLTAALGFQPGGEWSAFETAFVVPRQNGKGGILEARMLAGLFLLDERLLTFTAHEFKTAQEHFRRVAALVKSTPRLHRQVKQIYVAHGKEGIELKDGSRLKFLARSGGSGRGFSGDVVFLDEAYDLPPEAMGALIPTMSARTHVTVGGPQLWYASTAGKQDSEVLAGVRDRGIEGGESLCYIEFAAGDPEDHKGKHVDLDDRDGWYQANPAMWGEQPRLTEQFLEKERNALDDADFAREILGVWGGTKRSSPIDPDLWADLEDRNSKPDGTVAFAVDIPPERDHTSICVAGFRQDGRPHVEIVDRRPGTGWAVDRLAELVDKWDPSAVGLDPSSPAGSLITGLEDAGIEPELVVGREMAQACGAFYDEVVEERLRHLGQADLNVAVDAARKRKLSEAWAWHRRDTSADISPLVAATLALHLASKPQKRKRQYSGKANFI